VIDLTSLTLSGARGLLDRREISSVELTQAHLDRIDRLEPQLNAYIRVTGDIALAQAVRADEAMRRGEAGELAGIPMALKDILSTVGVPTTCGSRILENYVPQYNATVVDRLAASGAVVLGKTNMDEFAMGSSNENSAFGPVHNPWCLERVPGGSSGGSATAVASSEAVYALGTDTGGSIRQPAALTGTVGLKPTYGRVSRYGLVAFASSLDQIGPITRTVADAAAVLGVIAGPDPRDSTALNAPVPDYSAALTGDIRGLRVGIPREYFGDGLDSEVRVVVERAIEVLQSLGARAVPISLPSSEHALSTYYVISPAEAMANLARYDGVRYGLSLPGDDIWSMYALTREAGFGAEVKRRIILGTYVLSAGYYDAYYRKAQQVRTLVRRDFDAAFGEVDVIVGPTTPTPAFPIGAKVDDPLQMYLNDVYTVPINMAGITAVSVPAGLASGLPVGVQIIGRALDEETILRVGDAFERETGHNLLRPPMTAEVSA